MLRKIKSRLPGVLPVQVILCFCSAAMLFLAFPYFNLHYLAWFALVPWLAVIENSSRKRALLLSYLTGILFWGATVYWIIHVTLVGMIGMIFYLSLYFAAFGFIVSTARLRFSLAKVLFVPAVWVLLEFLRSHLLTGFPWALLAYTQSSRLAIIQAADLTGAWGISFMLLAVNVAVSGVLAWMIRGKRFSMAASGFVLLLLLVVAVYGKARLNESRPPGAAGYTIGIVQGNVPHEQKWKPETSDAVMATHLRLSREAGKHADLVVWSEGALPVILEDEPDYFEQAKNSVSANNIPLLLGAVTHRGDRFFNSALLLMPSGQTDGRYDKIHLVPFGEYIPLRAVFPFLETLAPIGEESRGTEYTVFRLQSGRGRPELPFSTLICFEDLFPEMARKFVHNGAALLVNITNDAWYRFSPATYQHCQAAVFRAVENRVPVVRCANTGVSCFIDEHGTVIGILTEGVSGGQLFFPGYLQGTIFTAARPPTVYNRYGDYFIWICWFFVFIGASRYFADRP
jgi:apolipoprotein N-acyltransferase